MLKALRLGLTAIAVAVATGLSRDEASAAAYETGAYKVYSPLGTERWVNSPSRFHNGCEPYTTYYTDAPQFDTGACGPAAGGQWSMDIQAADNHAAFIDVAPGSIDGLAAGSTYRVVAGDTGSWGGSNGGYQYFGIHTWNPNSGIWENYAWILLGHIDTFQFSSGSTVISSTTNRGTVIVAYVAPEGIWQEHLHFETTNYFGGTFYSRSYNWDGPENDYDQDTSEHCNRTGSYGPYNCNARIRGADVVGYVGGRKTTWLQVDNPYYTWF